MTPDAVFSIVNPLAAAGWLLLLVLYNRPWVVGTVVKLVIPVALALVYVALIPRFFTSTGGFDSLDAVARLFGDRWLLLAGWVHYLLRPDHRRLAGRGRAVAGRAAPARRAVPGPHLPLRSHRVVVV